MKRMLAALCVAWAAASAVGQSYVAELWSNDPERPAGGLLWITVDRFSHTFAGGVSIEDAPEWEGLTLVGWEISSSPWWWYGWTYRWELRDSQSRVVEWGLLGSEIRLGSSISEPDYFGFEPYSGGSWSGVLRRW